MRRTARLFLILCLTALLVTPGFLSAQEVEDPAAQYVELQVPDIARMIQILSASPAVAAINTEPGIALPPELLALVNDWIANNPTRTPGLLMVIFTPPPSNEAFTLGILFGGGAK